MDPIDREIAKLEQARRDLEGYRLVRGARSKFQIVKSAGDQLYDTYHGQDPTLMEPPKQDDYHAAGHIVKKSHDFTYRPKDYSIASERMHSEVTRDPILAPQSSDPKNTKSIVHENVRRLYHTDPILNAPASDGRFRNGVGVIGKRNWLMPSNGNRNPILDGDESTFKPPKRMLPEYYEGRENKFVPRALCRAPKKDIDPDSAGARSQEIGRRKAWDAHFDQFKSVRNRSNHIQPKEGKEQQFRNSRRFGPTSHLLQKRNPILQKEKEFENYQPKPRVKTYEHHLKRSDPANNEYKWRNSRGAVKDRNSLLSPNMRSLIKGDAVPQGHDSRTEWRPSVKTSQAWLSSAKDIYQHDHSGPISNKDEILENMRQKELYAEQIRRFHHERPPPSRSSRPATAKQSQLRSSMNIFDHDGERAPSDIYLRRQEYLSR
mmetsp:Transcript_13382/g.21878  ORF Transcript_13382/g.21878 Transcript_13382/m.21878 type:complete len:432 (-) Transcript_13382:136-1431(-)